MATNKTSVNPEFLYVPIGNIVVLEQVRSNVNIEADSFKSLVQSIKDKGIINSGKGGSRGRGFERSSENKTCSQFTAIDRCLDVWKFS